MKAEITRQKARALQVERQLEADIINPEDANRRMAEEQARGDAATIIETGRAEAEALKRLIEEYRKAGPSAAPEAGGYMRVWRRSERGVWQVALELHTMPRR